MGERTSVTLAAAVVVAACLACGKKAPTPAPTVTAASTSAGATAASAPARPRFPVHNYGKRVELKEVLDTYRTNEVRADALYKGKHLVFSGKVGVVKKGVLDSTYATLGVTGGAFERPLVQAFFDSDAHEDMSSLAAASPGDKITIDCQCAGLSFNVLMKSCTFVRPLAAQVLCDALVTDGLAAKCIQITDAGKVGDFDGVDMRFFQSAAGLKGIVITMSTDEDFKEETGLEDKDPDFAKVTFVRSERLRVNIGIDKTALQSEKDALRTWVDAL